MTNIEYNKARLHRAKCNKKQNYNQDLKRARNSTTTISSSAYLQILGTGMDTHNTLPSILLFFDDFRVIFNAGEGLQRFCTEHKIKLSKVDYVCLTRVCSETVGGLPGLLLTLAGIGKGHVAKLWGPSDLDLLISAMKSFVPCAAIHHEKPDSLQASQTQSSPVECKYVCGNNDVKISAVFLQPDMVEVSNLEPCDLSVVYICELTEIKGKFNREKAENLGVKPGPKYTKLKFMDYNDPNGVESDYSNDPVSRKVLPRDVMDPPTAGPIVFIVDCPTEAHAEKLYKSQFLINYCVYPTVEENTKIRTVNCIIHLTPPSVANTFKYKKWMRMFCSAEHVMAGHFKKNVRVPVLQSSSRLYSHLNCLSPKFFPALPINDEELVEMPCDSVLAENLLKFTLLPVAQLGLGNSMVPYIMTPSQVDNGFLSEIANTVDTEDKDMSEGPPLDLISRSSCLENIKEDDAEIVFLGTGSSQPSKYRNVSSIYFDLFSKGSLLLDCGEGTLAQLRRRYGMEGANSAVRKLCCIWISHIHADHHAGLVRILALRRALLKENHHEPLHVIGPEQLKTFLDEYEKLETLDMQFVNCRSTTSESWDNSSTIVTKCQTLSSDYLVVECKENEEAKHVKSSSSFTTSNLQSCSKRRKLSTSVDESLPLPGSLKDVLKEAGLEKLTSFGVVHCHEAFGVSLEARRFNETGILIPGWKVVYSGDTRPCDAVKNASRDATLLIHEATFENDLEKEAVARNHSTIKDALHIGDSADVYRIILTHFSQRYPKLPVIDEKNCQKACIAFDLMTVNMADLPLLPDIVPSLRPLFKNDEINFKDDEIDLVGDD